jgi:hypothetical protein
VQFVSPYGGLGLNARSVSTAYRRVRDLIDRCGIGTCVYFAELSVTEPCSEALLLELRGSPMADSTFSGGGADPEPGRNEEAIGRFGHVHDALEAEAWVAFGVPRTVAWHVHLRFPHAEPSVTPTFSAMYTDVCEGLGMKLPPGNLRVMSLTKRGETKARKLDDAGELTWSRQVER